MNRLTRSRFLYDSATNVVLIDEYKNTASIKSVFLLALPIAFANTLQVTCTRTPLSERANIWLTIRPLPVMSDDVQSMSNGGFLEVVLRSPCSCSCGVMLRWARPPTFFQTRPPDQSAIALARPLAYRDGCSTSINDYILLGCLKLDITIAHILVLTTQNSIEIYLISHAHPSSCPANNQTNRPTTLGPRPSWTKYYYHLPTKPERTKISTHIWSSP
jgi:hypothetical protein